MLTKEQRFQKLQALVDKGIVVQKACEKMKVPVPTYYNWKKKFKQTEDIPTKKIKHSDKHQNDEQKLLAFKKLYQKFLKEADKILT